MTSIQGGPADGAVTPDDLPGVAALRVDVAYLSGGGLLGSVGCARNAAGEDPPPDVKDRLLEIAAFAALRTHSDPARLLAFLTAPHDNVEEYRAS